MREYPMPSTLRDHIAIERRGRIAGSRARSCNPSWGAHRSMSGYAMP
jgi:hypothetical protein